jgi:energy-converting hydrogenase Eha subunit A
MPSLDFASYRRAQIGAMVGQCQAAAVAAQRSRRFPSPVLWLGAEAFFRPGAQLDPGGWVAAVKTGASSAARRAWS